MSQLDAEGILPLILSHLKTALEIDPNNQQAKDLLDWISGSIPGSVSKTDAGYTFLGLTATPLPPTPWQVATETAFPTLTAVVPTYTPPPTTQFDYFPPTKTPTATNPLCGSAALILPAFAALFWFSRRRIS